MLVDFCWHLPGLLLNGCCSPTSVNCIGRFNSIKCTTTHLYSVQCSSEIVLICQHCNHESHPIHQPNLICRILWPHVLRLEVSIHNNSPGICPAICCRCSISIIANKTSLTLQGPHSHYVECLPLVVGMPDRTGPILPFVAQGIQDEILATWTALTTSTLSIV